MRPLTEGEPFWFHAAPEKAAEAPATGPRGGFPLTTGATGEAQPTMGQEGSGASALRRAKPPSTNTSSTNTLSTRIEAAFAVPLPAGRCRFGSGRSGSCWARAPGVAPGRRLLHPVAVENARGAWLGCNPDRRGSDWRQRFHTRAALGIDLGCCGAATSWSGAVLDWGDCLTSVLTGLVFRASRATVLYYRIRQRGAFASLSLSAVGCGAEEIRRLRRSGAGVQGA